MSENRQQHTPAPWIFRDGKEGIMASGECLKTAGRTKRAIANRALIAAAPEMLEQLMIAESMAMNFAADIEAGRLIHRHAADNLRLAAKGFREALARAGNGKGVEGE